MIRYLLDTEVCIFILRKKSPRVRDKLAEVGETEVGVSEVTAFELYYGAERSADARRARRTVETFLSRIRPQPWAGEVARRAAVARADLAAKGAPIGPYDVQIAGHALALNATLVTNNLREFRRVPGLSVENWLE